MSFSTVNVDTKDVVNVSKYLSYGINYCKIVSMSVIKARSTESRKVQFQMEGAPEGKDFQGVDGAKGKVGRVETSYMSSDKAYKDFMRQIGVIADKLDVRAAVDGVSASTIEEYVDQVSKILKGRFAWWMFGAEEYDPRKFKMTLLKYAFIKADNEVDPESLKVEGYIATEIKNKEGAIAMKFDKTNRFHFSAFVAPNSDNSIPSAQAAMKDLPFALPASGNFNVDDIPFGNEVNDLPFN